MRFTIGQQVQVIDSDCRQLHGKIVTVIGKNPKRTAEFEVLTAGGNVWNIHGCFLRAVGEQCATTTN
jgi:hypothetical protein